MSAVMYDSVHVDVEIIKHRRLLLLLLLLLLRRCIRISLSRRIGISQ